MKNNSNYLEILIKIKSKLFNSQIKLASGLGFSIGKLIFCLKALKDKILIEIDNFKTPHEDKL